MWEQLLLVAAMSVDSFAAGAAYGAQKIKIGIAPALVVSAAGAAALFLTVSLGGFLSVFLDPALCRAAGFLVLFAVGFLNVAQGTLRHAVRKRRERGANMRFRVRELNFFVEVLIDETKADSDRSKVLSVREAFFLAAALSLDSLAAGAGFGLGGMDAFLLGAAAFAVNLAAVYLGRLCGRAVSRGNRLELSWVGGIVLIVLAVVRFVLN